MLFLQMASVVFSVASSHSHEMLLINIHACTHSNKETYLADINFRLGSLNTIKASTPSIKCQQYNIICFTAAVLTTGERSLYLSVVLYFAKGACEYNVTSLCGVEFCFEKHAFYWCFSLYGSSYGNSVCMLQELKYSAICPFLSLSLSLSLSPHRYSHLVES